MAKMKFITELRLRGLAFLMLQPKGNVMRSSVTASVLGIALIAGCSTPGYKAAEKTNNSLGDVKTELISDKARLRETVDDLNDLVYHPQADLRPQYTKFAASVTSLEKSAAASQASAKGMVTNREAYMSKWRSDVSAMSDVDLRMRALDRINETEKHFTVVGDKLIEADNSLSPLVKDLKALSVFLGSDLTANGIKTITDRATGAKNQSISVNQKIDTAIVELDKVSDEIAPMPATQPATMESTSAPAM